MISVELTEQEVSLIEDTLTSILNSGELSSEHFKALSVQIIEKLYESKNNYD